jgi:hypothetical protein
VDAELLVEAAWAAAVARFGTCWLHSGPLADVAGPEEPAGQADAVDIAVLRPGSSPVYAAELRDARVAAMLRDG